MSYQPPQLLVEQVLTVNPNPLARQLPATILGPNYQVIRYSEAAEKVLGYLGEYDDAAETCYVWPNRTPGAVVDQSWTRIFMDDALMQYFINPASTGDQINATFCQGLDLWQPSAFRNMIRAQTVNWQEYGAWTRDSDLYERDVQVGDVAKISAVVDGSTVTLWTTIAGFINEKLAGFVSSAQEDPDNQGGTPLESLSSLAPGIAWTKLTTDNTVDIFAATTPPNLPEQGFIDGVAADTYRIEVVQAGDYTDAILRVTSASGTDDVAELTPAAWNTMTAFGNKGLAVEFEHGVGDTFELGAAWELQVQFGAVDVDPVSGGTFDGPSNTTYIITVTRGGSFTSATPPQITVSTSTGIDSSGPHNVTVATPITIGVYGITIAFTDLISGGGLYKNDRYYIACTAPVAGAVRTLVLGHNLPDELLGVDGDGVCGTAPDLSVTLYIQDDVEITEGRTGYAPLVNWSTTATQVCLKDGIVGYDSTWVDSNGVLLPMPVRGGTAYVQYRALITTASEVLTIEDEAGAAVLGAYTPDNPLRYGVSWALANSAGVPVKALRIASDNLAGYTAAIEKLTERDDVYGITPMTFDTTVQDLVRSHVLSMSTAETGRWRRGYVSTPLVETDGIVTETTGGAAVLAKIVDDPDTSGSQYTLVLLQTASIDFVEAGVLPGDLFRTGYTTDGFGNATYQEYVVDAVLAGDSLRLVTGPTAAVTVAAKIEIWRNLSAEAQVDRCLTDMGRLASRRISNILPDYSEVGSDSVAGYFLAAAYAGLRSGVTPQKSLTNSVIAGPSTVDRTTKRFSASQMNRLAGAGNVLVVQAPSGRIYIRHALTTDMTDLNTREEMVTVNADSVSYYLLDSIAPFIGVSNVVPSALARIETELRQAVNYLMQFSDVMVGGQMVEAEIGPVEQHPTLADRFVVEIVPVWPYPMNNGVITLVI